MFRKIASLLSGLFLILASGLFTVYQCPSPTEPPGNSTPSITNQTFTVAEDATNGTIIGIVNASDDNAVTNYVITNANTTFAIISNGQLILITNLNYGTAFNYNLAVEVTDNEGGSASATITGMSLMYSNGRLDIPNEIKNLKYPLGEI